MPPTDCPVCGRPIAQEVGTCPGCGNPGSTCYACPAAAAERCQGCGVVSCPQHLQATYMLRAGQYPFTVPLTERFCRRCYFSAKAKQWLVGAFAVAVFGAILACLAWAVIDRYF
jgi:hypothetical protein